MKRYLLPLLLFLVSSAAAQELPSKFVTLSPTVTASGTYTSGLTLGDLQTVTNSVSPHYHTGYLTGFNLTINITTAAPVDLYIFESNPGASTITDHTAFDIDDTDQSKVLLVENLDTTKIHNSLSNSVEYVGSLADPVRTPSGTTLYAAVVARGTMVLPSTPIVTMKFAFANDLQQAPH